MISLHISFIQNAFLLFLFKPFFVIWHIILEHLIVLLSQLKQFHLFIANCSIQIVIRYFVVFIFIVLIIIEPQISIFLVSDLFPIFIPTVFLLAHFYCSSVKLYTVRILIQISITFSNPEIIQVIFLIFVEFDIQTNSL